MRPSTSLFDSLSDTYDEHFAERHRWAYDELSWRAVVELLPTADPEFPVVDVGCGVGRWAERLVAAGHRVVGIEQAPRMAARARSRGLGAAFEVIESPMDRVELPPGGASLVLAMGSLQYATDPEAMVDRFARWVRPGGRVAVLVDSLGALAVELMRSGRIEEAEDRLRTRRGVWRVGEEAADLHLFDAERLASALGNAGLVDVEVRGLLVGWTVWGPQGARKRLDDDPEGALSLEARLSYERALVDSGKQLLGLAQRPL